MQSPLPDWAWPLRPVVLISRRIRDDGHASYFEYIVSWHYCRSIPWTDGSCCLVFSMPLTSIGNSRFLAWESRQLYNDPFPHEGVIHWIHLLRLLLHNMRIDSAGGIMMTSFGHSFILQHLLRLDVIDGASPLSAGYAALPSLA